MWRSCAVGVSRSMRGCRKTRASQGPHSAPSRECRLQLFAPLPFSPFRLPPPWPLHHFGLLLVPAAPHNLVLAPTDTQWPHLHARDDRAHLRLYLAPRPLAREGQALEHWCIWVTRRVEGDLSCSDRNEGNEESVACSVVCRSSSRIPFSCPLTIDDSRLCARPC